VVNHGGVGTVLNSALYAVPQLTMGYHFDEPIIARGLAAQGCALQVGPDVTVRDGVLRLLDEPAFAGRAADLRDEIHAMPSPNDLVPRLEELTAKHR
ncbi:glycosyltransferase, partial [Streptosporangium sp. NPDC001682]